MAAGGDGSEATPFRTILEAMDHVPAAQAGIPAGQGTIVLHEASEAYDESVAITGERLLAIVAAGSDRPRIALDTSSALITIVDDETIAYLDGLSLESNTHGPGLRIQEDARAYVDRCEVTKNLMGIEVTGDAVLVLRNSVVTASSESEVALQIDTATADIVYSTLLHNALGAAAAPDALRCVGSDVTVRSSIVLSVDPEVSGWDCTGAEASHTVTATILVGSSNVHVCELDGFDCTDDDAIPSLFDELTSLRLTPLGAELLAGTDLLMPGDPSFDIDLNPRASNRDFAGAHAPPE